MAQRMDRLPTEIGGLNKIRSAFLLRKGNDITINRGVSFDVFTDANRTISREVGQTMPVSPAVPTYTAPSEASAKISIVSAIVGADVEIDGMFNGNVPTTISLPNGQHRVVVKQGAKSWQRTLHVSDGSAVTLKAAVQ